MMNYLKSLDVMPEDVFREVAYLLDFILYTQDITQRRVDGLWTLLVNDIRSWKSDAQDEDKLLVAGTIFLIARDALCHHWDNRYSEDIYGMFTETLDEKLNIDDDKKYSLLFERLDECSQLLSDWINKYDEAEEWLSDDIGKCLRKKKPEGKKDTGQHPMADYSRFSFSLIPQAKYRGKENIILDWLHKELVDKGFVIDYDISGQDDVLKQLVNEERKKVVFNAVFSGSDTDYHIVWIGRKVELRYFILQLIARKALSWKKGPGKWQITRNRIWYGQKVREQSDATVRVYTNYNYIQFGEHDFDKGNVPTYTEELDKILDVIAPPVSNSRKGDGNDIADEFRGYEDYETNRKNNRGRKLAEGFKDTSHKPKE